jgi:hypothetical protein
MEKIQGNEKERPCEAWWESRGGNAGYVNELKILIPLRTKGLSEFCIGF